MTCVAEWKDFQESGKPLDSDEFCWTKEDLSPLPVKGFIKLQVQAQKFLKPAMWLPGFRYPHNWWETWTVESAGPETCTRDMGRAIENVSISAGSPEGVGGGLMLFHLSSLRYSAEERTGYAKMLCLTKARWMDIVELKITAPQGGGEGSEVSAHGYATGFLPLNIPFAFLMNIPLCFIPFSDRKIIRTSWMPGIRNRLEHTATVKPGSESYKI